MIMTEKENTLRSESGFTLIEAILSLLVLGIMGAVVGFGFSIMAQVYVNNANMVTATTKTEVAMERLRKDFLHIDSVDAAQTSEILITFTTADHPGVPRTVSYTYDSTNNEGFLYFDGYLLLDGIQTFSFTYYDDYTDTNGRQVWVDGTSSIIGINLTMEQVGSGASNLNYETRVMPRNL